MASTVIEDPDFSKIVTDSDGWVTQLDRLRESDPIYWSARQNAWLITRHADITVALRGDLPLSNHRIHDFAFAAIPRDEWATAIPNLSHYLIHWLINIDAPDHKRLRPLLVRAFSKRVVESVRPFARQTISDLLDRKQPRPQVEFAEEIARIIPSVTLFKLLGVADEHIPKLAGWSNDLSAALANPRATREDLIAAEQTLVEMNVLFAELIDDRREHPTDDLISGMIQAVDGGERLSKDEMIGICQLLLVAGQETTSNSMTFDILALDRHPQQRDWLAAHPEAIEQATLELSRQTGMSSTQTRIVAEDFEWGGKSLKKGDMVFLMIVTGNRDPRVFERPEELDFGRPHLDRALTFAPGLHHCIGHLLARMQIGELLAVVLERFERVEVLDEDVNYLPFFIFRTIGTLNVRFHPRTRHAA